MKRMAQEVVTVAHITAVARTATTPIKGTGVDVSTYRDVTAVCGLFAIGAVVTADFKLQHSDTDTDGNYADISGAAAVQLGESDDDKVALISVRPSKKYLRAVHTPGGTVANGVTAGVILLLAGGPTVPTVNAPVAVVV